MNLESELRTTMRDRAELIPDLPAPYADLHRRLRRSNRTRAAVAGAATVALVAAGVLTYHATRNTVGAATTGHWPVRGDQAGDPNAVKQAETAADRAEHARPGTMMPLFVGNLDGHHVVVAISTAVMRTPGTEGGRVVLVDGMPATNLVITPISGIAAWATADLQFPDHRSVELILAESPGVTATFSHTVTWDAAGTPQRTWSPNEISQGYAAIPVPPGQESLYRFRVYASGALVHEEMLDDGKTPSSVRPPASLLDSMANTYGQTVSNTAVAMALEAAAPIAGDTDYAGWQPKILWSGTSATYGGDSVLVQVKIRGSVLQGLAGNNANRQPVAFVPVPAARADHPYYFTVLPLGEAGVKGEAEVWVAGGATAQTAQSGKVLATVPLDSSGRGVVLGGDMSTPFDLTVRDAHGTVILHRTDVNQQTGAWDLPVDDPN